MTAARMVPARTSALCMSTEDSFKVPDLDFVFADKCVLVDVSGTDPLDGIRHDVAGVPGHALAIRAGAKHTKYGVMAANQGKEFFPFVVETSGGLGRDALRLLKDYL